MTIQVACSSCGRTMSLQADDSAGQEIIDTLSRVIQCRKCIPEFYETAEKPKKTPSPKPEYRAPYAD